MLEQNCCARWKDGRRIRSGLPTNDWGGVDPEINRDGGDNHQSGVEWTVFPNELLGTCESVPVGEVETWRMVVTFGDSEACLPVGDPNVVNNNQSAAFAANLVVCADKAYLKLAAVGRVEQFRRMADVIIVWVDGTIVLVGQSYDDEVTCTNAERKVCTVIELDNGEHSVEVLFTTGDEFNNDGIQWELNISVSCDELTCGLGEGDDGLDDGLTDNPYEQPEIPPSDGGGGDGNPELPPPEGGDPDPVLEVVCDCDATAVNVHIEGYPAGPITCAVGDGRNVTYWPSRLNGDYVLMDHSGTFFFVRTGGSIISPNCGDGDPDPDLGVLLMEIEDPAATGFEAKWERMYMTGMAANISCSPCSPGYSLAGTVVAPLLIVQQIDENGDLLAPCGEQFGGSLTPNLPTEFNVVDSTCYESACGGVAPLELIDPLFLCGTLYDAPTGTVQVIGTSS